MTTLHITTAGTINVIIAKQEQFQYVHSIILTLETHVFHNTYFIATVKLFLFLLHKYAFTYVPTFLNYVGSLA